MKTERSKANVPPLMIILTMSVERRGETNKYKEVELAMSHVTHSLSMSRSTSPLEMDIDNKSTKDDKPDAKVVIITNLTRNVVESHLQSIFGFYGRIMKIDLPLFGKCLYCSV